MLRPYHTRASVEVLGPPEDGEPPWVAAGREVLAGRPLAAAEIYARMPQRPEEALARLLAAEQLLRDGRRHEADEQLRRALSFFRSVGAALYVREAEGLLARTA